MGSPNLAIESQSQGIDGKPSPSKQDNLLTEAIMDDTDLPSRKRPSPPCDSEPAKTEQDTQKRPARAFEAMSFVRATSSDAYFLSNSHRRNFANRKLGRDLLRGTSGKKISELLHPLDIAQLPRIAQEALSPGSPKLPARTVHSRLALDLHMRPDRCAMYISQLLSGFHLIFYGVGDRSPIVGDVVQKAASQHTGAAVLIQGAAGRALNVDRVLDAIESAILLTKAQALDLDPHCSFPRHQFVRMSRIAQRIARIAQLLLYASKGKTSAHPKRLFLGLIAFDHPLMHTSRLHTLFHALARCPQVSICASVTHIHAGLLLDGTSGHFSQGLTSHAEEWKADDLGILSERDVRAPWLWHHCTTYIPPITEMLHSRGATMTSSTSASAQFSGLATLKLPAALDLAGRGAKMPSASGGIPATPISEAAALQVLNTITARARTLFSQLALLQLATIDLHNEQEPGWSARIPYSALVREATREFTASSDEGVKQLLGEMVDHGLVLVFRGALAISSSHAIAAGDELLIPLTSMIIENLLAQIVTE
ncbi:Origin recognition complex subunit 2 [Malassezia yamatoensis]|uniref:Origin recognition complex subunit 2 n=1 Tax=Malassezia yamatoensis TaxID=253288 RepID=A0AAJ5YWL6_9BASI|nr:Origin recognition complex subunit 2 [Malassezia yamatoensis]